MTDKENLLDLLACVEVYMTKPSTFNLTEEAELLADVRAEVEILDNEIALEEQVMPMRDTEPPRTRTIVSNMNQVVFGLLWFAGVCALGTYIGFALLVLNGVVHL